MVLTNKVLVKDGFTGDSLVWVDKPNDWIYNPPVVGDVYDTPPEPKIDINDPSYIPEAVVVVVNNGTNTNSSSTNTKV